MAVSTTDTFSGPYVANGVTVEFPFTFKAASAAELRVFVVPSDGFEYTVEVDLYRVTLAPQGGTVLFDIAPAGGDLYVESQPSFRQDIAFASGQPYQPATVNEANDRAAIRDLVLKRDVGRGVRMPIGEEGFQLPPADVRALKSLAFDSEGAPVAAALPNNQIIVDLDPIIATAGQATFTFPGLNDNLVEVQVNGVVLPVASYTVAGSVVTFDPPRSDGDYVKPRVLGSWSTALRFRNATPTAPGLMTITDKIKSDGIVDMKSIGAVFDGSYDNAQRFVDAAGELQRGGKIDLGHYGNLYTSADIDLPPNILMKGQWYPQKPRLSWNYLDTCPSTLILEPDRTVKMNGSKVENVLFWQANINQNPPTEAKFYEELAKFDGNAFTATGDDPCVHQCMMIGFARAGLVYNVFRPEITENVFDCLGGFDVSAVYDFRGRGISNNLGQAVYIQFRPWPIAVTRRPGKAIYVHDVADAVTVKDNKSYGYLTGLHLKNIFAVKASHISDGPALPDPVAGIGTRGIWLEGLLNSCEITSSHADGQETGFYIEASGNLQLGTNSCGFALLNQVYLGAGTHGSLGNMTLSGNCDTPISAAAGVGEWHGSVDSSTFAGSGDLLFHLDAIGDKNKLKDLIRRQPEPSVQMTDAFPQGVGEYSFATKPVSPKPSTRIRVTDAGNAPTAFGAALTGGGANVVEAVYLNGTWRVG
ncbi:hypothetical protein [Sphingobium sp. YR657]|uniref:hypothetical protein n=1 Tax=Sphingobium sp. YR657 TaxID=1884366 RepID=UPI00313783A1